MKYLNHNNDYVCQLKLSPSKSYISVLSVFNRAKRRLTVIIHNVGKMLNSWGKKREKSIVKKSARAYALSWPMAGLEQI